MKRDRNTHRRIATINSHHSVFLSRTANILGVHESDIKNILVNHSFKSFRINWLRYPGPKDELVKNIEQLGIKLWPLKWFNDAYIFNSEDTALLQASASAQQGHIFIQNPSSYLPVIALEAGPNDSVLDMCSAPGGKATMIASITNNPKNLTLNEPKEARVRKLQEVLGIQGVVGAQVVSEDGRHLPNQLTNKFDRIIIDAECSTEAGINFLSKAPLTGWSEEYILGMSVLQKQLISAGYDLLKPGGVLIYSTCTFAPEENEAVIASLQERRPDAVVQPLIFTSEKRIRKIKSWQGNHFPAHISESVLRIYPSDYMEGFFLARIRKPTEDKTINAELVRPVDLTKLAKNMLPIDAKLPVIHARSKDV